MVIVKNIHIQNYSELIIGGNHMEKIYFEVHDVDDKGNKITITCEGVDDQQLAYLVV
jgi:1-aminocyclopropane-1-carboxylate deaminase/D-cysteine desulfhydrase-like pyridoxal-dependent ACC family enzyme